MASLIASFFNLPVLFYSLPNEKQANFPPLSSCYSCKVFLSEHKKSQSGKLHSERKTYFCNLFIGFCFITHHLSEKSITLYKQSEQSYSFLLLT